MYHSFHSSIRTPSPSVDDFSRQATRGLPPTHEITTTQPPNLENQLYGPYPIADGHIYEAPETSGFIGMESASQGVQSQRDLGDRYLRGNAGLQGIASVIHSHPFNLGYDSSSTSPVSSNSSSSPTYEHYPSPAPIYQGEYPVSNWAQNFDPSVHSPERTTLGQTLQYRRTNSVELGLLPPETAGPLRRPRQVASDRVRAQALARRKPLPKGRKLFHCTVEGCDADFTAKHNLNNHMNSHGDFKPYGCGHCGRPFTTSSDRSRHIREHCPALKKTKVAA